MCVNAYVCFTCMDMHACVYMQLYVTASARVCFSQYAYLYICVCMFCVYLCNGVGTIITLHEGTDSSMAINYCRTVILKKCGSHIIDCGY